jgi:hypothetical protein
MTVQTFGFPRLAENCFEVGERYNAYTSARVPIWPDALSPFHLCQDS